MLTRAALPALQPLPPALLQPFISAIADRLASRHAAILDRLTPFDGAICLIDPTDLPFAFALTIRCPPGRPAMRILPKTAAPPVAASIHAPLHRLVDLLQGRLDGDALFFSRELTVEGDMELIVALRNAIDGVPIDLVADLASAFGPLSGVARRAAAQLLWVGDRTVQDLMRVRDAVLAPALRRSEALEEEVCRLREEVAELRRRAAAGRSRPSVSAGQGSR